jgi:hypothetical protein
MENRTFQTCTNCGQDLGIALTHLFWRSDCPQNFEYNCKACGAVLSIEVESLPQFWVELKQLPTPRTLDEDLGCCCAAIGNNGVVNPACPRHGQGEQRR